MYPDGNLWRCGIAGGVNPKQETKAKPLPSKSLHAAGGICKLSLARKLPKAWPMSTQPLRHRRRHPPAAGHRWAGTYHKLS